MRFNLFCLKVFLTGYISAIFFATKCISLSSRVTRKSKSKLACSKGEMEIGAVIGGIFVLLAYLMFPQSFHHFFQYLIQMVIDAVHSSFGTGDKGSGKVRGDGSVQFPNPSEKQPLNKNK